MVVIKVEIETVLQQMHRAGDFDEQIGGQGAIEPVAAETSQHIAGRRDMLQHVPHDHQIAVKIAV